MYANELNMYSNTQAYPMHTQMSPVYSKQKKLCMQLQEWSGMCPISFLKRALYILNWALYIPREKKKPYMQLQKFKWYVSDVHAQKSPINTQMDPYAHSKKGLYTISKFEWRISDMYPQKSPIEEPYTHSKEPYTHSNEPCILFQKKTYM